MAKMQFVLALTISATDVAFYASQMCSVIGVKVQTC